MRAWAMGHGQRSIMVNIEDRDGVPWGIVSFIAQVPTDGVSADDPELEAIKACVREMEEEAEKLKEMQSEVD